jgi:putative ABC transport system permease protein
VLGLVARQGFALVAIGMLLGLAASLAMTRVISKYLWGVTATDPFTFVLALMAMLLVASTACFVPIRNALRIDPIKALRWE